MKNNKKTICTILMTLLSLCLACTLTVGASAANVQEPIVPLWDYIRQITLDITFSEDSGNVQGMARKQSTADRIEATLVLYKQVGSDWEYVDEWYQSKTVGSISINESFTAVSGETYKAELTVTAYTGTVGETHTEELIKTCP